MPAAKRSKNSNTQSNRAKPKVVNNRNQKWGVGTYFSSWKGRLVTVLAFVVIGGLTMTWAQAATTTSSLWSNADIPKVLTDSDSQSVELGVRFKAKYAGKVEGIKFYKGPQNTGTHVGNLWRSDGKKLASVTFKNETSSGWQTALFSEPVSISANTTYVVSYFAPNGHYSVTQDYFTAARTNGPLTAHRSNNGVYAYGSRSSYPSQTYKASNYWVDVVYSTQRFTPTTKPAAPTNLTASVNNTTVSLGWTKSVSTGVGSYRILRDGTAVGESNTTSYVDTALTPGKSYSYTVLAVDGTGLASDASNTAKATIPQPTPTTPTPTPTTPTPTTPTPTPTTPTPGTGAQACPAYPAFPDANCTGVPAGVTLSTYTDSCSITTANTVIDSKQINCSLDIRAAGVQIKNSRINGMVNTPDGALNYSFSISDSEVIAPTATSFNGNATAVGEANFTMLRVEVTGGNRSVYCRKNCTVQDSWIHGQKIADSPRIHASAIRQSQGAKIIHNRILCEASDTSSGGGCSADLTGYGDFEPVQNNRIEKNLFVATPAGACAYGGSSGDDGSKPYGNQASNIVFVDNVFERGSGGKCGYYFPITDFDSNRPGNQWTNNRWNDGAQLPPAN